MIAYRILGIVVKLYHYRIERPFDTSPALGEVGGISRRERAKAHLWKGSIATGTDCIGSLSMFYIRRLN